jgi:sortase A
VKDSAEVAVDAGTSAASPEAAGAEDAGAKVDEAKVDGAPADASLDDASLDDASLDDASQADASQADAPASEADAPAPAPRPQPPQSTADRVLRATASVVLLALLFGVGFFVYLYGLSGMSYSHAQSAMFKNFVYQLDQATAPIGPTVLNAAGKRVPVAQGAPVAVLNIPQIGLHDVVVVNGTTSSDLALGPGHVRASVLPGQAGVSVVYGKVATYGAPFAHLMQLNRGDRFTVTTGQGTATYQVESFGTSTVPAPADSTNRLILETAASSFVPSSAVQVSADLVSAPRESPGGWPLITPPEVDMASNSANALIPLMLWSQALLIAVIIATVAANRWSRWPTYLCMAPVVIALIWCVYENLAALLPNLY